MRIGLIDVDGHNYPNLPLMKISAWHKAQGDSVEWYDPFSGLCEEYDKVYMSKVFSFSEDYEHPIYAKEVVRGGSGYCISLVDGKEVYDKSKDIDLPYEIEHIYPNYELYGIDYAIGFMSRGCPRGCDFCHVASKEGNKSYKVADLTEFWGGQKDIVLCDPNTLACRDWEDILNQLIESKANIEFNQGLDIRMMTEKKADMLSKIKLKNVHFAFDRYQDMEMIMPMFEKFKDTYQKNIRYVSVYVLCNYDTTVDQDLERIYALRQLGYSPYVMLYDKEHIPRGHMLKKMQRWCNNRMLFWSNPTLEDYMNFGKEDQHGVL